MLLAEEDQDETAGIMRSIKFAMTLSEFYSSYTTIKKIRFYDTINWRVYDSYPERTEQSETPSWETITAFTDTKSSSEWTGFSVSAKEASSISLLRRVNNYNGKFVGVMELVIDEARLTVCTGTLNLRIWNFWWMPVDASYHPAIKPDLGKI